MGSKKINQTLVLDSAPLAGTASVYSLVQNVQNFDNIGVEVIFTGTPTGTLLVCGAVFNPSLNPYDARSYGPTVQLPANNNPIPAGNALTFDPPLTQPTGAPLRYLIDLNQFPFPWLQFEYTNASGTGTLTIHVFEKDLN
jgi:hypothetical protein